MTTSKLSTYSTTAASNNSAAPNGWPEGMLPSDVNNCAREGMARVREWYEDAQWINFGHTIVSSTGTTIVVSGDQTAIYSTYRAIRVNQSASQDGWVTSSTYSAPNTTITVNGFTVSSPTLIEVGIISSGQSLPQNMEVVLYAPTINGTTTAGAANFSGAVTVSSTLATTGTATVGALIIGSTPLVIATGTYTPTIVNGTNIAASTSAVCCYHRVGSMVTVTGRIQTDPTSSGLDSTVTLTLPVASTFANIYEAAGSANGIGGLSGFIYANAGASTVSLAYESIGTAAVYHFIHFTYKIV